MDDDRCRSLLAAAPSAVLATVRPGGSPHLVPIVHALLPGDLVVFAVDGKPKRTTRLQRLINLEHEPRVAVLAHHYDDDWDRLWWVRADGTAVIAGEGAARRAITALAARYALYRERPPAGPVVAITVTAWRGWEAAPPSRISPPG